MRARTSVVALAAVLLLAQGCSANGEDEPEPTPIMPTDSTPTQTPTETETAEPDPGSESAEDFVRRWQKVSDEMQRTGDLTEYRKLYEDCPPCEDFAKVVEDLHASGGHVEGGGNQVTEAVIVSRAPVIVRASLTAEPMSVVQASGEAQEFPGGSQTLKFYLGGRPGQWTMRTYSLLPS